MRPFIETPRHLAWRFQGLRHRLVILHTPNREESLLPTYTKCNSLSPSRMQRLSTLHRSNLRLRARMWLDLPVSPDSIAKQT